MPIVFSQIRVFHAVAEHGGFTAAARVLNVGQPTLLTETGVALFEITRGIMKFCDEANDLLSTYGRSETGTLRLAAVEPFHTTEILAAFRRSHPNIEISILLGNSQRTLEHIINFEAEVAILAHVREDPRVQMVPYRSHRVIVFVNHEHPWFTRKSVKMRDLADRPFVLRERGSTTRRTFEAAMTEDGLEMKPVFEIESREGVWKAVERELGISVVADSVAVHNITLVSRS